MKLPVIVVGPEIEARLHWGSLRGCPAIGDLKPGPILIAIGQPSGLVSITLLGLMDGCDQAFDGRRWYYFSRVVKILPLQVWAPACVWLMEMTGQHLHVVWGDEWATITFDGLKVGVNHQSITETNQCDSIATVDSRLPAESLVDPAKAGDAVAG
jgi:hypothetical protein